MIKIVILGGLEFDDYIPALTLTLFPGAEFDSNSPKLGESWRNMAEQHQKPTFLYLYVAGNWKK